MAKLELGIGLKVVAIVVSCLLMIAFGIGVGIVYTESKLRQSNVEVLKTDSEEGEKITQETKEKLDETDGQLKGVKVLNSDGYVSNEFLQLLQSEVADAERRGDQTLLIRAITHP